MQYLIIQCPFKCHTLTSSSAAMSCNRSLAADAASLGARVRMRMLRGRVSEKVLRRRLILGGRGVELVFRAPVGRPNSRPANNSVFPFDIFGHDSECPCVPILVLLLEDHRCSLPWCDRLPSSPVHVTFT